MAHLDLWDVVWEAQFAAFMSARNGTIAASVDRAARTVISRAGYGEYFTHRLGHGAFSACLSE